MNKPEVRVGVAVFVYKDGKFLVAQRRNSHGHSTWSIPGGHLEVNESIEDCAAREVLEETGMRVKNIRFLAITNDIFSEGKHYVSIWMTSDWESGEPIITEPEKCTAQMWCTIDTLPSPLFEPCWQNLRKSAPQLFGGIL